MGGTVWLFDREMQIAGGENLATTLLRAGVRSWTGDARSGIPNVRRVFCAAGWCKQCPVSVNGAPHVLACDHVLSVDDRVTT